MNTWDRKREERRAVEREGVELVRNYFAEHPDELSFVRCKLREIQQREGLLPYTVFFSESYLFAAHSMNRVFASANPDLHAWIAHTISYIEKYIVSPELSAADYGAYLSLRDSVQRQLNTHFLEHPAELETLVGEFRERHRDLAVRLETYVLATFGRTGTVRDSAVAQETFQLVRETYLRRRDEGDPVCSADGGCEPVQTLDTNPPKTGRTSAAVEQAFATLRSGTSVGHDRVVPAARGGRRRRGRTR